jgi:hypothetical protein
MKMETAGYSETMVPGHAVAQAGSPWLPTTVARVCIQAEHVGFVVDKAALGQVFKYFSFPCQSSFDQFLHHHFHPGLAQQAYWWLQCKVNLIGLQSSTIPIKKIIYY